MFEGGGALGDGSINHEVANFCLVWMERGPNVEDCRDAAHDAVAVRGITEIRAGDFSGRELLFETVL